jgi:hypothetical protein
MDQGHGGTDGVVGQGATPASVVWSRSSAFFFISLYMQEVLHFSALRAGAAYVPIAAIAMAGSIGGSGLVPRLGTRPIIVAGAIIATSGLYWISQIPVHGHYWTDIFPPLMITSLGLVFVGVQIAGNAGALLTAHHTVPDALVGGYTRALLGAAIFVGTVVLIGLRAANTKGEAPGGLPAENTGS